MRSIMVGEVRTGLRITRIPVADATWSTSLTDGSIQVEIPLGASEFAQLERTYIGGIYPGPTLFPSPTTYPHEALGVWRPGDGLRPELLAALTPVRAFLAVLEDDYVIEAGPIWTWAYDDDTKILKVGAAGLSSLLDRRYVMAAISSDWAAWEQTWTGLERGTIIKRLISLATSHAGGDLPIVLPDDVTGTHERTYHGYDLATVLRRVAEISGTDGGPEWTLRPRLRADRLGIEWVLLTGTEDDPHVHAAARWIFDYSAPRGPVRGLSVGRDASAQSTRAWTTGSGSDLALLMARAEPADIGALDLRDYGYPLTETRSDHPTDGTQAAINAWSTGDLRAALRPTQTWTLTVDAAGSPGLGTYRPGDDTTVRIGAHPLLSLMLSDDQYPARIMRISGGMGQTVQVALMPAMEVR